MRIGSVDLDDERLVMAEIGNNHEGRPGVARELVERAAEAGAGAVKLQVFEARRFVRPQDRARLAQLERFQLPRSAIEGLCGLAHERGLAVVATPLDLETVEFLTPLVDGLKIASGDNDFHPLIERVAETGLPMIISSGLATTGELAAAKDVAKRCWADRAIDSELAVLHCVSAYPTSPEAADLGRIVRLRDDLGGTVGYSDHTLGTGACVTAARLGARILEKHFTLDHEFSEFRDHALSANPDELVQLVDAVAAVGEEDLGPADVPGDSHLRRAAEEPNRRAARRSIVAAADLAAGQVIAAEDLSWLRPRDGLVPGEEHLLIGRPLRRAVSHGQTVTVEDVEV